MIEVGSVIAGRYKLAQLVGEGGMASVWRADDQTLKRSVAIKLLYLRGHRDPQAIVEHFLREARIAASVQHRNVIHTVDFGVADESLPYMVMELLSGESLAERMQREPRMTMTEVVHIAGLTLRGLAAVHEAGIVHRDLKPQNIFLHRDTDAVYPKILDFGISRSLDEAGGRSSAISTQEGLIVGTPDYMSPEQARGEADIDKRSDIYSMAAIIYEGITGQLPFQADTIGDLIVKVVTTTPKSMREVRPDVPEVLSDCVAQAMARDREARFVDAQVFRRALLLAADKAFKSAPNAPRAPDESRRENLQTQLEAPARAAAVWGDFEGLGDRPGRKPEPREPSSAHLVLPGAANEGRSAPKAKPVASVPLPDAGVLGESPFDALGMATPDQAPLDLDYGGDSGAAQRAKRSAVVKGQTVAAGRRAEGRDKRPAAGGTRGATAKDVPSKAVRSRKRGAKSSLLPWLLPVLLLLGFLSLVLRPGWLSLKAPESSVLLERQARSPAGALQRENDQASQATIDRGELAPELRDVTF
jgi:serine/threonine protein kinase